MCLFVNGHSFVRKVKQKSSAKTCAQASSSESSDPWMFTNIFDKPRLCLQIPQQVRRSRRLQRKQPTEKKTSFTPSTTGNTINKISSSAPDSFPLDKREVLHKYKKAIQDSGHRAVDPKKPIVALLRRSSRLKTLAGW